MLNLTPKNTPQILDCTISEGGYKNNWRFNDDFVENLYNNLSTTGIEYIELGFLNNFEIFGGNICGKWRFITEENLRSVILRKRAKISLLINFKNLDITKIPAKCDSIVDVIRISFEVDDLYSAITSAQTIKKMGYTTFLLPIGIHLYTSDQIITLVKYFSNSKLDALYVCDSFGNLYSNQLEEIAKNILSNFYSLNIYDPPLGIHVHNTHSGALGNIDKLLSMYNFRVIDTSMGEWGAIPSTESVVAYLNKCHTTAYKFLSLLTLSNKLNFLDNHTIVRIITSYLDAHPLYYEKLIEYNITLPENAWNILDNLQEKSVYSSEGLNNTIKILVTNGIDITQS